jgi:CDP-diacylglycerol---glycerol-3-phosphate 3-phosphatidyltransferase
MSMNLYRLKPASLRAVEPLVDYCVRRRIRPDTLTLLAVPIAFIGAVAIGASPLVPGLLLLVPVAAAVRLVLNLLDGAVARRTAASHPRGELYNEVGDRVGDVLLLGAPALLPGVEGRAVLLGVLLAVLASYVGITVRAAGGPRLYHGILAKPGRMVLLAVAAPLSLAAGPVAWNDYAVVLIVGAGLTLAARARTAVRDLA